MNGFLDIGVVPHNPFHAEMDATQEGPGATSPGRQPGTVDRDSQGRVRIEHVVPKDSKSSGTAQGQEAEQHLIYICDPVGHALIRIDPLKRAVRITRLDPPDPLLNYTLPNRPPFCGARTKFGHLETKYEDLGVQAVLGLQVRGSRLILVNNGGRASKQPDTILTVEDWCSEELVAVLIHHATVVRENKTVNEGHSSLVKLVHTEPEAALFQIPPGYTVTEEVMGRISISP